MKGAWEFVLVERMEPPMQTAGGLFLPSSEKEPLYVVRVVSLGDGVVGESGMLAPTEVSSQGRG
jgi:co-chaperonin GroES (HSP10)